MSEAFHTCRFCKYGMPFCYFCGMKNINLFVFLLTAPFLKLCSDALKEERAPLSNNPKEFVIVKNGNDYSLKLPQFFSKVKSDDNSIFRFENEYKGLYLHILSEGITSLPVETENGSYQDFEIFSRISAGYQIDNYFSKTDELAVLVH